MNMGINPARRQNHALSRHHFGRSPNDNIDRILNVGIAGFADFDNFSVFNANIRLNNAPPIEDQGIGDHQIDGSLFTGNGGLTHAVSNDFATPKFDLIPVDRQILLDFDQKVGIR